MKNKLISAVSLASLLFTSMAFAETEKESEKKLIERAQERLSASFSNWSVSYFGESPIEGIYEVHSGDKIIYFHEEKGIIIFGRMFNGQGEDLTQISLNEQSSTKLADLPLKDAITVQKGKIPLIEITNPDCSYCNRYEQWISQVSKTYSIERKIIYMENQGFPMARGKIEKVFCAKDKAKAYQNMVEGKNSNEKPCKEAAAIFESHNKIVESLGVSGTPTFLLPDGSMIVGFKPAEIEQYLINSTKK